MPTAIPPVDKRHQLDEAVFTYLATKAGKVFIYWRGTKVTILNGDEARRFLDKIPGLGHREAQLLMARLTGNFKRGNER